MCPLSTRVWMFSSGAPTSITSAMTRAAASAIAQLPLQLADFLLVNLEAVGRVVPSITVGDRVDLDTEPVLGADEGDVETVIDGDEGAIEAVIAAVQNRI